MIKYVVINKRQLSSGATVRKYHVVYENGNVEVFGTPSKQIEKFIAENRKDYNKVKYTFNAV